jgi:hypothetical protein
VSGPRTDLGLSLDVLGDPSGEALRCRGDPSGAAVRCGKSEDSPREVDTGCACVAGAASGFLSADEVLGRGEPLADVVIM